MTSVRASSMARIAVFTAASNISSGSPGPKSPASYALTDANHQPGLPCDPMTDVGRRGRASVMRDLRWGFGGPQVWGPHVRWGFGGPQEWGPHVQRCARRWRPARPRAV